MSVTFPDFPVIVVKSFFKEIRNMKELDDKQLEFVAGNYKPGSFDTVRAMDRFHKEHPQYGVHRRWWMAVAASVAVVAVGFAAGYAVHSSRPAQEAPAVMTEPAVLNPDVAQTHVFVYDSAPLADVLSELSAYYGCTLKTDSKGKALTATFPDDDVDFIVSMIEKALDVDIIVEK